MIQTQNHIAIQCRHCDFFVEQNDHGYFHLYSEDDKEFEHDAEPGKSMLLSEWKKERPDLFFTHVDLSIGPNSRFHKHRNTSGVVIYTD